LSSEEQPEFDPTKFEQYEDLTDLQNLFIGYFKATVNVKEAARLAGCGSSSHQFWITTTPAYQKAFESCRSVIAASVEHTLGQILLNGVTESTYERVMEDSVKGNGDGLMLMKKRVRHDPAAMQRYLAKAKPEVFGDKIEIDASIQPVSPAEMLTALVGTVPYVEEEDGLPSDDAHLDGDSASDTEEAV